MCQYSQNKMLVKAVQAVIGRLGFGRNVEHGLLYPGGSSPDKVTWRDARPLCGTSESTLQLLMRYLRELGLVQIKQVARLLGVEMERVELRIKIRIGLYVSSLESGCREACEQRMYIIICDEYLCEISRRIQEEVHSIAKL